GHPIANDPCYGGELHFGNPEAKRRAEENPASEGTPREGTPKLDAHLSSRFPCFKVRTCSMCQGGERFKETQLHCVGIWLHALRYQVGR
ncbi:unnamed protein product, partial [Hapterophycus canaliculatus]